MAVKKPIKRGQKMRKHACNKLEQAINNTVNQDLKCQKHNLRHPDDQRELFTDGDGVEEALDILSSRILYMKTGQTS